MYRIIPVLFLLLLSSMIHFSTTFSMDNTPCDCEQIELCDCTLERDKMELLKLYHQLDGSSWSCTDELPNEGECQWNPNGSIYDWYGVEINQGTAGDFVSCVDLDGEFYISNGVASCGFTQDFTGGVQLNGYLPDNFCMPCLETLSISFNDNLQGTLEPFVNFCSLRSLFIKNSSISGTIPLEITNLKHLRHLHLNNNLLEGIIPTALLNLENLEGLFLVGNDFHGEVPDFFSLENFRHLTIAENQFTFEDILPIFIANNATTLDSFEYAPQQQTFFSDTTFYPPIGYTLTIDLEVDENVSDNTYYWYKNEQPVPFDSLQENELTLLIADTSMQDYICKVTNERVTICPDPKTCLILETDTITVQPCVPTIETIAHTLCPGETYTHTNGMVYDESRPTDTIIDTNLEQERCEVTEIHLSFYPPVEEIIDTTLCAGEILSINGQDYSETGEYVATFEQATENGCDSTVFITLTIADVPFLEAANANVGSENEIAVCEPMLTLNANLPEGTTGIWESISGNHIIDDMTAPMSSIEFQETGRHELIWSLSYENCLDYSHDVITLFYEYLLTDSDTFYVRQDSILEDDFLKKNTIVLADTMIMVETSATVGNLCVPIAGICDNAPLPTVGTFTYTPKENFLGEDYFMYQISGTTCTSNMNRVTVIVQPALDETAPYSNILTPNGDGYNDYFVIYGIEKNKPEFMENELRIYSIWGTQVYYKKNYQNEFTGMYNGKPLPAAAYSFIFDYGNQQKLMGNVVILRAED